MIKRVLWTLAAVVVAAVIFLLTLRADPARQRDAAPLTPLPGWQTAASEGTAPNVGQYFIEFPGEKGLIYQLFGAALNPLPQGVLRVEQPMARIHLKRNQRVVQIEAQRATFVAPDNRPRSGTFEGDVVLTFFECRSGQKLDLRADSPHAQLRLHMQGASFNLELGEVRSDGAVRLVTREFEFRGRELDLIFNQLHRRLDRLEIAKGDTLRIRADAERRGNQRPESAKPENAADPAAPDAAQDSADQYYRALFADDVRITAQQNEVTADDLEVLFGLSLAANANRSLQPEREASTTSADASPSATETPAGAALPDSLPPQPDDIVVQWAGALLVTPLEAQPPTLRDVRDALLTLRGQPVRITPPRGQIITCAQLSFQRGSDQVTLDSDELHPVVLEAPQMGALRARKMVLDIRQGSGQILGGGALRTTGAEQVSQEMVGIQWSDRVDLAFYPPDDAADALAPAGAADPGLDAKLGGSLRALRSIVFRGDVRVDHVQFDLRSDLLSIGLTAPQDTRQDLSSLVASGDVQFNFHARQLEQRFNVDSDVLEVVLEQHANGRPRARQVVARGNVHAVRPGQVLQTERLTVNLRHPDDPQESPEPRFDPTQLTGGVAVPQATHALDRMLGPKPATTQTAAPTPAASAPKSLLQWQDQPATDQPADAVAVADANANPGREVSLRNIVAQGAVRVRLEQENLEVTAQRLIADEQQVEIFGTPDTPAEARRIDGVLRGNHLVLVPATETLYVIGAGSLRNQAAEAGVAEVPGLAVFWQDNMQFHNQSGLARFYGNVRAASRRGGETTDLEADVVSIEFHTFAALKQVLQRTGEDAALTDPRQGTLKPDANIDERTRMLQGLQQIKTVTADGGVIFEAADWEKRPGEKLLTRMRLTGPTISFDNVISEEIIVKGAGTLLAEERRPREKQDADGDPRKQVHFGGAGATLFTWQGQLALNLVHNDMKIEDQVQVLHVPPGESDIFQLDCQRFLADLEATGGLGVWMSSRTPRPELVAVYADRDVRVLNRNREITTDHLEYTHFDRTIVLRAEEGKLSRIVDADGNTGGARLFRWNLREDRMEIVDPGRISAPVR